jgi:hypothetical protein
MSYIDKTIFFTIAQGVLYEKMAENLFLSLKSKNNKIKTACISNNPIKYCDYLFKISDLCPLTNDINECHINEQSYSFKLGIYRKIPQIFLNLFEKIIFYDCDSICLNSIEVDESIFDSKFYVPWCQSIVTEDPVIKFKIDENWAWSGANFKKHCEFAKLNNIQEWKNVNAGLIVISTQELNNLIELYSDLTDKIYKFYGKNHGTEEITFSLMMSIIDPKYQTPNICNNKIGQLCMNDSIQKVRINNKFEYSPWFNSTSTQSYTVFPTCVHFPSQKKELLNNLK